MSHSSQMFLQNRYVFNLLILSSGVLPWDLACTLKGFNYPEKPIRPHAGTGRNEFFLHSFPEKRNKK